MSERKTKGLPAGMGPRLWTMMWFTLALGFTGFGNAAELVTMPAFGWLGVLVAMGMYVLWRERTRPRANGFWILMSIIWFAFVLIPIRPYLGLIAALPVALLWLHDSPATPSAMLTWGLLATVRQDQAVWDAATIDTAFYVILAMVLVIGAAQSERERLAKRTYAPTSKIWMTGRLAALVGWSLALLGLRESLAAVNFLRSLGFDLSQTGGKITAMMIMLLALALAAMLFRVRPDKAVDLYAQPKDKHGRRLAKPTAEAPKRVKAAKVAKPAKPARPDANVRASPKTPNAPAAARPAPKGALKPGEIDFD